MAASDHVATTLLLDAAALGRPRHAPPPAAPVDAATKACTFRPQASLKSFFAPQPKRPAEPAAAGGGAGGASSKRPCASYS